MSDITSDSDVALSKDSSDSSITEDLYLPQPSAFSPRPSSAATSLASGAIPGSILYITNKEGRITVGDLNQLVSTGCNRKVNVDEAKESIHTLRFIYKELQKHPGERIPALQQMIDNVSAEPVPVDSIAGHERVICDIIVAKLHRYFHTGIEEKGATGVDPRVSQRFKKTLTSMQQDDASHSSDDTTHVSRFKSPKGFKF